MAMLAAATSTLRELLYMMDLTALMSPKTWQMQLESFYEMASAAPMSKKMQQMPLESPKAMASLSFCLGSAPCFLPLRKIRLKNKPYLRCRDA